MRIYERRMMRELADLPDGTVYGYAAPDGVVSVEIAGEGVVAFAYRADFATWIGEQIEQGRMPAALRSRLPADQ